MKKQLNKSIIPQGFVAQSSKVAKSPVTNTAVAHDDIARRAYEIYVEKGYVQGQSEQDWQQAEEEQKDRSTVTHLLKK